MEASTEPTEVPDGTVEEVEVTEEQTVVTIDGEEEPGKEDKEGEEEVGEEEMDAEIEAMKLRFKEFEEEASKISTVLPTAAPTGPPAPNPAQDERSVYVGNVDYSATNEELKDFFVSCGSVVRVTILCDKWTGPKGYAYVEFKEPQSVVEALLLNDTPFKGRQIKVSPKRTNVPLAQRGGRGAPRGAPRGGAPPRGRPFRGGAGGAPGGFYSPRRPFRPRRGYHPYY